MLRDDRAPALSRRARALWVALSLLALAPAARPAAAEVINRIVATVDGDPLTVFEMKQFLAAQIRAPETPLPDSEEILEALVTQRLIVKEFESLGLKIQDEDIDRYIDTIRQRNRLTQEQLEQALAQQGVPMDRYREQVRDELRRAQLINREIRGKVNVTPEEVERYYQANLDDYAKAETITLSHIVLQLPPDASPEQVEAVRQRAEAIHAELEKGADFATLAREHSEDAAAESGGALGTFKPGEMLEAIEKASQKLEPGGYSEPVRSDVGFHIVRLDERSGASHAPLADQAEEIKQKLYAAALEERYNRWLREDLRKKHNVEILP